MAPNPTVASYVNQFSTTGMPGHEAYEVWREATKTISEIRVSGTMNPETFNVDVTGWSLGPLALVTGRFPARLGLRDRKLIRAHDLDYYRLLLPLDCAISWSGEDRCRTASSGNVLMTDFTREELSDCGPGRLLQVVIDRETLDRMLPRPIDLHGFIPRGPLATLLAGHLSSFAQQLPSMTHEEAVAMGDATLHLIASAAGLGSPIDQVAKRTVEDALRRRMLDYIDAHLLDPDLGTDHLYAQFRVSRASLYRLFQPLGGVSVQIQERRLKRIYLELSEPNRHHLGEMAYRYCFSSQQRLNRAFRAFYGHAPGDTPVGQRKGQRPEASAVPIYFAERRVDGR